MVTGFQHSLGEHWPAAGPLQLRGGPAPAHDRLCVALSVATVALS